MNKSICHWDTSGECLGNWGAKHRVGDLVASPDGRILIAMDDQMHIYVYDLATLELRVEIKLQSRPLSVSVSQDGVHVLVNKVNGEAQLIDLITQEAVQKYVGFMAEECIIRSGFGGANESFVVCGSDGKIFFFLFLFSFLCFITSTLATGLLTSLQMVLSPYGTRALGCSYSG